MSETAIPESRWAVATHLIRERKLGFAMAGGGAVYGLTAFLGFHWFQCPFLQVTGKPCPGCGLTRASLAMFRGDWRSMLHFHPFAPFFTIFWSAVAVGLLCPLKWRDGYVRRLEQLEAVTRWPLWIGIGLAAYSLTRWLKIC